MIRGIVIVGDGKAGKDYGLPTANLRLYEEPLIDYGVYTARVTVDQKSYKAIVSYGAGLTEKFETHLFGFKGDLYGQEIEVDIKRRVSDMEPFVDEVQMRKKVKNDVRLARRLGF